MIKNMEARSKLEINERIVLLLNEADFVREDLRNRAEEKVVELNPTGKGTVQTTLI